MYVLLYGFIHFRCGCSVLPSLLVITICFFLNFISNKNNRGCSFLTKSKIAQRAGAIAAIIMDNEENQIDRMIDMADDHTGRSVEIPSAFLTGKDG